MRITNFSKGNTLADKATIADSFFSRMVGLLNRSSLSSGEGLVITNCNSIHMFFMRFPIDVIFINKTNSVVGLVENIKPFRLSRIYFAANRAIELPPGTISQTKTTLGDVIEIE